VGSISDANYRPIPAVTLKGHWLEDAGFETETPLEVRVMNGCMILTVKQSTEEPEVIQTLRQLCPELSARKQRELLGMIEVITKAKKRNAG